MSEFGEHLSNMSSEMWLYALEALPHHLMRSGRVEEAIEVLCDLQYLDERCKRLDVYELLQDYEEVHTPTLMEFEQFRDFIRKHAQRLSRYPGLLFSLIQLEGFPATKDRAHQLVEQRKWHKPWIQAIPAWMPSYQEAETSTETLEVLTQSQFTPSVAVALAGKRHIAFFLRRLGEIGMIDLTSGRELPDIVPVDHLRPLALFCSPRADLLAIAFENGKAHVLRLSSHQANFTVQRIAVITYLVPKCEAPIMIFVGDDLWYQTGQGVLARLHVAGGQVSYTSVVLPVGIGHGEVSGIIPMAEQICILLRQRKNTTLIALVPRGDVTSLQLANTDVVCGSAVGQNFVALALTNFHITIFDCNSTIIQVSDQVVDGLPACMASDADKLFWITIYGKMYTWVPGKLGSIRMIQNALYSGLHAQQLSIGPNGRMDAVTSSTAFRLTITSSGVHRPSTIAAIFAAPGAEQNYYAVQEQSEEIWLLNSASQEYRRMVTRLHSLKYAKYAVDGINYLIGVGMTGQGFLTNLMEQVVRRIENLPLNVTSVAGNPKSGFWLTDQTGTIYFFDYRDSTCSETTQIQHGVGQCEIRSWPGLVLWKGICSRHSEIGLGDFTNTIIFFQPGVMGTLQAIGERFFPGTGAFNQVVTYDPVQRLLWVVGRHELSSQASIMIGTPQDFIQHREQEKEIRGVDPNILAAQMIPDDNGLLLLCESGNLFHLDRQTLQVRAVLSGTIPITGISQSYSPDSSPVLVLGQKDLFFYTFQEGDN